MCITKRGRVGILKRDSEENFLGFFAFLDSWVVQDLREKTNYFLLVYDGPVNLRKEEVD